MSKILITGGDGFLGTHLTKLLDLYTSNEYSIFSRKFGYDLTKILNLVEVLKEYKPDIIIHCAADVGSLNYVHDNAGDIINNNITMYLNLYKGIVESGTNPVVINIISNCSYPGASDIQNEGQWWDGPIHDSVISYGGAKKTGFLISECYKIQYGINTINLILPNAYGPFDYLNEERTHAMNGIILRMIKAQRRGDKQFSVWGTGSPIREWIYMEDAARIILHIINQLKDNKGNYILPPNPLNIGKQEGISIRETAELVKKFLNADIEIVYDTTKRDGALIKVLGNTNFKKWLPSFEFTTYNEGLYKTIEWYKKMI